MYIETRGFISVNSINEIVNFLEDRSISFNDNGDSIYFDIDTSLSNQLYDSGFINEDEYFSLKKCDVLECYE